MSLASAAMSLASSVAGRDFFDLVKAIGIAFIYSFLFVCSWPFPFTCFIVTHSFIYLLAYLPTELLTNLFTLAH